MAVRVEKSPVPADYIIGTTNWDPVQRSVRIRYESNVTDF